MSRVSELLEKKIVENISKEEVENLKVEKIDNKWIYYYDEVLKQDVYYIEGFSYDSNIYYNSITLIRNSRDKKNKQIVLTVSSGPYGESSFTKTFNLSNENNLKEVKTKVVELINSLIKSDNLELLK